MISERRLRKAFTNGVLQAHQHGYLDQVHYDYCKWLRIAYEAGYREGEKVVRKHAAARSRGPDPYVSERSVEVTHDWLTHPLPPREPTTPDPGEKKERIRGHY